MRMRPTTLLLLCLTSILSACAEGGGGDVDAGPVVLTDAGEATDAGVVSAECQDGVMNGDETGTDCGGSCDPCAIGQGCAVGADCESGVCMGGVCAAPTCVDGAMNGAETDVDCGGATCPACAGGQMCAMDSDCQSMSCEAGVCSTSHCDNTVQDQDETDVDCGGAMCGPCAAGQGCAAPDDCESLVCTGGACAAAACDDGVMNQDETDVDCGGATCSPCADGLMCGAPTDCVSGVCTGGACVAPSCSDGVANGGESGVDCGGTSMCGLCMAGAGCTMASDCDSGVCTGGACAAASCTDGLQNGGESDVDCGGASACPRCPDGSMCTMASDCATGMCTSGTCGDTCGTQFLRINELHGGDGPGFDYVEIINTGTCSVSLSGIAITTSHNCSSTRQISYSFPSTANLAAGAVARVVDVSSGLMANEYYAGPICWDGGAEGWTALCSGSCNLSTCSNFIDYQEQNDVAGRPTGAPSCATFTPAPFDVSSITSAFGSEAVQRTGFTGSGSSGVASDWSIGTYTR